MHDSLPKIQQSFGEKVLTYEERLKTIDNYRLKIFANIMPVRTPQIIYVSLSLPEKLHQLVRKNYYSLKIPLKKR